MSIRYPRHREVVQRIMAVTTAAVALLSTILLPGASTVVAAAGSAASAPARPNILFILADDLGYSDVGAFGGEIPTPNIDALARQGRIYTNMYATPLCAITRAEFISGTDHHRVGLGTMLPPDERQKGAPGYEGYLTDRALSIAEVLRDGGYHTYMAGKWHLGMEAGQSPKARGFESSYALLPGFGDHYVASPGRYLGAEAHMYVYRQDDRIVEPPADFYSTDFYTDRLIADIDRNRGDGKPFFVYAAYTSPHWPLQAPPSFVARQQGRYDAGYDVIRKRRLARQRQLGIVPADLQPAERVPATFAYTDQHMQIDPAIDSRHWSALTAAERRIEARRMEIYAAMIGNLDWNIGRLVQHLRDIGEYDRTLIVFMSDNGAAANGWVPRAAALIDNRFENLGQRDSYVTYTPRWAEVSNAPLRLWKMTTAEGGVAVPLIVHLPGQTSALPLSRAILTVKDLAPTFAEIAGIAHPGTPYRGREVFPWTGSSALALFRGQADATHADTSVFADESNYEYYVRQGRWKAVWMPPPEGTGGLQLYDIGADRGETRDLAATQPQVVQRMQQLYADYVRRVGVVQK